MAGELAVRQRMINVAFLRHGDLYGRGTFPSEKGR